MRRRRNAAVLAVSLAGHLALLAAWLSTQPRLHFVEPPVMEVQLVRPPAPPREPERPSAHRPPAMRPAKAPQQVPVPPRIEPPPPPPQIEISPEWRVKATPSARPPGLPFASQPAIRPPPCKSSRDHSDRPGDPCPSWSAEEQASHYNVVNDPKAGAFAAEGERKLALKDYRGKPGKPGPGPADASDYPGIRCSIFHTHC